jgi:RNA polymerase sigma-70 factor, ECF subfamily
LQKIPRKTSELHTSFCGMLNIANVHWNRSENRVPVDDPDGSVVERARVAPDGDLRPFEELVRKYQKRIVANCRYLTGETNAADDLAQEIFIKAYFGLRSFEGRSPFWSWLRAVKVRHCLTHLKRRHRQTLVYLEDEIIEQSPELVTAPAAEANIERQGRREAVNRILDSMPEILRVPLILCDMDEFSYEQIASALNISLSAAKMRIKRAREEFRKRYRQYEVSQTPYPSEYA